MLSRTTFATIRKAAAGVVLLLVILNASVGCRHTPPPNQNRPQASKKSEPPLAEPAPEKSKIKYNAAYDKEIKEVLDLAAKDRWEEAQLKAADLHGKDPRNPLLERLQIWVNQSAQKRREQALEDKIRDIDAKNSVFAPTIPGLLVEKKDRGLPATKDIRDTVHRIENTPWIPDSYGKTLIETPPSFEFESTKGKMAKMLEKEVSVHVDNIPLQTAIVNLSQTSGVNIVADKSIPALTNVLVANFDKIKLGDFLRYVGRNYNLQFQVGDELVWVVDAKDPKTLMEETRFYRLRKGFILPAEFGADDATKTTVTTPQATSVTEVQKFKKFVNDQAPVMPSIEKAIKELFKGSKYIIDYERNMVVATGTPEQLAVMEKIIQEFDQPVQQVLIEARFVTLSKPAFLQLGVLWETGRSPTTSILPQDFTGLIGNANFPRALSASGAINPAVGLGISESFTNVLNSADLSATISALEQNGESQTLSAPRLTVLNNRPAQISDGKVQYYYEEYAVKTTVQQYYTASSFVPAGKPTKITAGAELNVMASISGDGKSILLALNPRVNTDVELVRYATLTDFQGGVSNATSTFDINLPQYRTQELSTRVAVKSGDTVVMGGVLERTRQTIVESVPVLGDIPLIGALFRRRTEVDTPRYLLIFVTATILKDTGEFLVLEDQHPATNSPSITR
jgi:type IV pilus assembly protein PilQ